MTRRWQIALEGPSSPCVGHTEPVVLRVWRAVGQGRWDTELHPLNGSTWPTPAEALQAVSDAGLDCERAQP